MALFFRRIIGAARLDRRVYEEVEADQSAFGQAFAVVAISSVATVVGSARDGCGSRLGNFCLGGLVGQTRADWVAVRQALDYRSTLRAVGVCSVGWVLYAGMLFGLMPRA